VALDHALVLVQHLLKTQTVNMELKNSLREMQAKMAEAGIDCDNNTSRISLEGPGTPDEEDEDDCSDDSYDSEDSDRCSIMPGSNLMEQIHNLETKESANRMGLSQKAPKSKALKVKQNNKMGQSQKPAQTFNKLGGATPKVSNREKIEHEKLYKVVEQTFRAQILDDEKYRIPYDLYQQENDESLPDQHILTTNFEKMRAHYNCLSELEATHGDLNKPDRLREVLKQNAFLLGLVSSKNKNMKLELNFLQRNYDRLSKEKKNDESEL